MQRIFIELKDSKRVNELGDLINGLLATQFGRSVMVRDEKLSGETIEAFRAHPVVSQVYTEKIPEAALQRMGRGIEYTGAILFNTYF